MIETLESKTMFTASLSVQLAAKGVLTITGSNANDDVEVRETATAVTVSAGDHVNQSWSFARNKVTSIKFNGGDGNDQILNATGFTMTANGGNGNDTLVGGSATSKLYGDAGDDVLVGDQRNDQLDGGAGNDFLLGGGGDDSLTGAAGNDQLFGDDGRDTLLGGDGNDTLSGDNGNDTLRGNAGNDNLFGGREADRIEVGTGSDTVFSTAKLDTVVGNGKDDRVETVSKDFTYDDQQLIQGRSVQDIAPLFLTAIQQWENADVAISDLDNTYVRIADLAGSELAWTVRDADGKQTVWLDVDAGGKTWFIDDTPDDDREFDRAVNELGIQVPGVHIALSSSPASNSVDLLTVIRHEIGHAAGLEHDNAFDVMVEGLSDGIRINSASGFLNNAPDHGKAFERMTWFGDLFGGLSPAGQWMFNYSAPDYSIPSYQQNMSGWNTSYSTLEDNIYYNVLANQIAGLSQYALYDTLSNPYISPLLSYSQLQQTINSPMQSAYGYSQNYFGNDPMMNNVLNQIFQNY